VTSLPLRDIVSFLDTSLRIAEFPADDSSNGLQVEGRAKVARIGVAVDACDAVFDIAWQRGVDLLIVHHGLIWGGITSISGIMKKRLQMLFDSGISLYACHLPLDWHPVLGNNIRLLKLLGIRKKGEFGEYHGRRIGYWGALPNAVPVSRFVKTVDQALDTQSHSALFRREARNIGVVSGGGWSAIHDAERLGIDTFLTGEPSHSAYCLAEELKINLVFAGHYATETLGVKAVQALLQRRFGIPSEFLHHPTGL
jgi:dinuclear metal center YbgI/SA1388 family protein